MQSHTPFVISEQIYTIKMDGLWGTIIACFVFGRQMFFCYVYVVMVENDSFAPKIQKSSLFLVELYRKGTVLTAFKFHLATYLDLTVILTSGVCVKDYQVPFCNNIHTQ